MHVEPQISGGLAGAIVQEAGLDDLPCAAPRAPALDRHREHAGARGQGRPSRRIHRSGRPSSSSTARSTRQRRRGPGELQRWRIFNADADRFVVLRLARGQRFTAARRGRSHAGARADRLLVADGPRLASRGARAWWAPGRYQLRGDPLRAFPGRRQAGRRRPGGRRNAAYAALGRTAAPVSFPPRARLPIRSTCATRRSTASARSCSANERTVGRDEVHAQRHDASTPNRTDVTMKLGSVEQWTLVNETSEWHTFHIHINDFQVVSVAGKPCRTSTTRTTSRCRRDRRP